MDHTRDRLQAGLREIHEDVGAFSAALYPARTLRGYQLPFARAVAESVLAGGGQELAAVFSRQSGKDEALAQLCAYLLSRYRLRGGNIVVALPSLRPQGLIARDRLLERLHTPLAGGALKVRDGAIVELGRASVRFLSAAPSANSRGNTASLLLVANEAQDIEPDVWDAVFAPMAASANATTLFLGTVWTSDTLLARQMRLLRERERHDGRRRLFLVPWRTVADELPVYGAYVRRQVAQLGEHHPFIRTEYELEELDGDGRLFPTERLAAMRGDFPALERPSSSDPPGSVYALTVDVAGELEEGVEGELVRRALPRKDSTAVCVVRVTPTAGGQPRYEVVARYLWTGTRHSALHERIVSLARDVWRALRVVVDATGVGAGLASFLRVSLGERIVQPFVFSAQSKSRLAWDLLGLLEAGRLRGFDSARTTDPEQRRLDELLQRQLAACRYTVLPGPGKLLRWSVEDETLHDDLLIATALIASLEGADWRPRAARGVVSPSA